NKSDTVERGLDALRKFSPAPVQELSGPLAEPLFYAGTPANWRVIELRNRGWTFARIGEHNGVPLYRLTGGK
ncbi:MAG: hypothetical protein ACRCZF_24780, partial [Gemmataceae bacterium]